MYEKILVSSFPKTARAKNYFKVSLWLCGSESFTCITLLHCFVSLCIGLTFIPCEGLHTDTIHEIIHGWLPAHTQHRRVDARNGLWLSAHGWMSFSEAVPGVCGCLWESSWEVLTFDTSANPRLIWLCGSEGGGKPYIMNINWRQRIRAIWKSWEDKAVLG